VVPKLTVLEQIKTIRPQQHTLQPRIRGLDST